VPAKNLQMKPMLLVSPAVTQSANKGLTDKGIVMKKITCLSVSLLLVLILGSCAHKKACDGTPGASGVEQQQGASCQGNMGKMMGPGHKDKCPMMKDGKCPCMKDGKCPMMKDGKCPCMKDGKCPMMKEGAPCEKCKMDK
jgi:hypothetical protein